MCIIKFAQHLARYILIALQLNPRKLGQNPLRELKKEKKEILHTTTHTTLRIKTRFIAGRQWFNPCKEKTVCKTKVFPLKAYGNISIRPTDRLLTEIHN